MCGGWAEDAASTSVGEGAAAAALAIDHEPGQHVSAAGDIRPINVNMTRIFCLPASSNLSSFSGHHHLPQPPYLANSCPTPSERPPRTLKYAHDRDDSPTIIHNSSQYSPLTWLNPPPLCSGLLFTKPRIPALFPRRGLKVRSPTYLHIQIHTLLGFLTWSINRFVCLSPNVESRRHSVPRDAPLCQSPPSSQLEPPPPLGPGPAEAALGRRHPQPRV